MTTDFSKVYFSFFICDESSCGFLLLKGMCVYCRCLCKHRAEGCDPSSCNSLGSGFVVLTQSAKTDITILVLIELQLDELWGMCPDLLFSIRVKAKGSLTKSLLCARYGNATMRLSPAQFSLHQLPSLCFPAAQAL